MRVPVTDGGLVQRGPGVSERFVAADSGGSGIGEGLQKLGQGLGQVAQDQEQVNHQLAEASAKTQDNAFVTFANSKLYDGPNAYFNLKGKAALDARPDVQDQIQQYGTDLLATTKDSLTKRLITDVVNQRLQGYQREIGLHSAQQTYEYNKDETSGRITTAASAAGNAWDDPETANKNLATLRSEATNYASMTGMGPDATSAFVLKNLSGAHKDIASRIIAAGPDGPRVGAAYVDKNAADLTSDDAQYLTHYVRTQQDYYDAQAHKAEVEAKQQQREQIKDAADTAEDVLRRARFGPLPPDQMAAGLAAAQKAGKPGLQFELATVSVTNKTKVAYENATPAELQDAINEITPKVRGDNPDPVLLAQHRALNDMLTQASTQLKQDPISWGAAHMGLPTAPIDWNNPASIQARAANAQKIAGRTGAQPKLLTDEETAQLSPQAASADPNVRKNLVFQLAKAGPMATIAARQIAPNDPSLIGLVGLATTPNAGVAANLVSKAIAGPETIKAYPKIIDHNFDTQFDGAVGNVLRGLDPSVAVGLRSVTRNLLATNSALAGTHITANTPQSVVASLNGALGAYNDNGVMRGGLGTHAGKPTILPDGVSQPEFDTRIARATKDQLLGASNGHPVWSNGKPLFTDDVKKMEFVPVGNGRYRLSNGSGYVTRKEGGFYELDMGRISR